VCVVVIVCTCVGGGVVVLICVYMLCRRRCVSCVDMCEAACAYVIALMAVYWCTEVLPLAVTSLLPTILFPVLGIMESKDVCVQYLKDTNFLFVGGLMMAVAVEHWDLHKRIALRVLLLVGVRPAMLMLGFMSVTAFLSMWISNTATTAMMVPIVQAVLDQLHGGEDLNQTETRPDIPAQLAVQVYTTGRSLAWLNGEEEERLRRSKGLLLCVCYAASIGGIATLTGTGPNLVLVGQMSQLFPENGDVVNFASWFGFAFPTMLLMLLLAWFWLQFLYIGCNLFRTWGCGSSPSEKEQAAYRLIQDEHRRLGPVSYAQGSVLLLFCLMVALWFTRDPRFMDGWATNLFNSNKEYVTDATVALFVAVLLFVLPSEPPTYLCFWRNAPSEPSVSSGPAPPLLTWQVTQKKMPWNIVLLLGGGFALAKGRVRSVAWLGEQMAPLQLIPPWAVAVLICLLVATFTECASNVATATLFLPILASMAQSMSLNPLYVMIPCTLSASFAFMLPVATPPNAIVFSYGYLKVSDMARTGVVMNIFGICCINLAINTWGQALFRLDTFPEWANATAPV
uniref:Solute carrier family 13 member 5 n=1 Tax=Neogobius melanostomus TaxID=47308 RepID=A0A8C6TWQ0_9GOBI